jgi:hypothetical protein
MHPRSTRLSETHAKPYAVVVETVVTWVVEMSGPWPSERVQPAASPWAAVLGQVCGRPSTSASRRNLTHIGKIVIIFFFSSSSL